MNSAQGDQRDALIDMASIEGQIRAAQIRGIVQFAPLIMAVTLVNAGLVAWIVAPVASPAGLALWAGTVLLIAAAMMRAWFKGFRSKRRTASPRAIRRAVVQGAALAAFWAVVPIAWFSRLDPYGQMVIATVVTGKICSGGFALSTVRPAAYAYVIILTGGAMAGFMMAALPYQYVMLALLTAYGLVIMTSVTGYARLFTERFLAEATLTERGQVIGLLLAEFEDNGSDWLFQTDAAGRMIHCSRRFLAVTGRDEASVQGTRLADLIAPEGRKALEAALAKAEPFRELTVAAEVEGRRAWWSLTAKPILDETGCTGWRGVGSDVTTAKAARDHVEWMARTDVLTGAANRASFVQAVEAALDDAAQSGRRVVLCAIDLDHFKTINDTFGHPVGDALLKIVADALRAMADETVTVGRLGGDEFAVLLERPDPSRSVAALAAGIAARLGATHLIDGSAVPVRVSLGVVRSDPAGETADGLMVKADLALYRAKQEGRNRIAIYDEALHREIQDQRMLRDQLAQALTNGELEVFYQPIVGLRSRRPVCCEALVRWRHPELGMIPPSRFIPLAESTGMIGELSRLVLHQATAEAATWPASIRLAVNISPAQIGRASLLSDIVGALAASGLAPGRLELEITEAIFLRDEIAAIGFIEQIKALGVRLALDDFGTGFSSLGYVARYPIDKIKIDRSFISGTAPIRNREAIVASIVRLAQDLNLTTTAEGVETEQEAAWISQLGCEQAQGYLYARPLCAADLRAFIMGSDGRARAIPAAAAG